MIDRRRVRELLEGRPGANAGAAREVGELPWVGPATHLLKMWTAPTLEEFDRLAEGFPAAFRRLRRIAMTHPRDHNLRSALEQLHGAAMGAYCGDPFADREAFERRGAMAARFRDLFFRLRFRPR